MQILKRNGLLCTIDEQGFNWPATETTSYGLHNFKQSTKSEINLMAYHHQA